jgi:hypothetical protein
VEKFVRHLCRLVLRHQMPVWNYFVNSFYSVPSVRDFTGDGRWSTYDVSVLKKMGRKMRTDRTPSKATITNKTRTAGSFSSS